MKTVGDFLKEQDCLFLKVTQHGKTYFCEYQTKSIAWHGKPVAVGVEWKDTCIVTELDEATVIDYSAPSLFKDNDGLSPWCINAWERASGLRAVDYIDRAARLEWLAAREEE